MATTGTLGGTFSLYKSSRSLSIGKGQSHVFLYRFDIMDDSKKTKYNQ
jgi:hypothetical protein